MLKCAKYGVIKIIISVQMISKWNTYFLSFSYLWRLSALTPLSKTFVCPPPTFSKNQDFCTKYSRNIHCVKRVYRFRTILIRRFPYLDWRKIKPRKNSLFRHFSHSDSWEWPDENPCHNFHKCWFFISLPPIKVFNSQWI